MKKVIIGLLLGCFCCGLILPAAAAVLPADSRALHGKIVKITRERKQHRYLITVKHKKEITLLHVPGNDPRRLMNTIRKNFQRPVTIIYLVPSGEITAVSRGAGKKARFK